MLAIRPYKNLLIPHVSPTNVCVFDLLLTECKRVFVERVACVFVFSFFFIGIVSKQFFTMTTKTGYQNSVTKDNFKSSNNRIIVSMESLRIFIPSFYRYIEGRRPRD